MYVQVRMLSYGLGLVTDPELMKEILSRADVLHKPAPDPIGETIAGGLVYLQDEKWAEHRGMFNQRETGHRRGEATGHDLLIKQLIVRIKSQRNI